MESHCYPMSKKFTNVFSNVTICTPAANSLLLCEIFQVYVKKFIMEVFQPSTLELLQSLQFFGITMSCEFWFLHQKYICHIVQWVNPCFKNVKLMVQQHCLDQSSHSRSSLELDHISRIILEMSIPHSHSSLKYDWEFSGVGSWNLWYFQLSDGTLPYPSSWKPHPKVAQ